MLERFIRSFFTAHGRFCAEHPSGVFVVGLLFTAAMMVGIVQLRIEQSPVHLWVEPDTRTATDMDFFNNAFKPFFRVEEVILSSPSGIATNDAFLESLTFHEQLLSTADPVFGVTLEDICWKPITGKGCLIQNWLNYLQNDPVTVAQRINTTDPESTAKWLYNCVSNPVSQPCFSSLGLPTEPITVFGQGDLDEVNKLYNAKATLMTYLVINSNDPSYVAAVRSWEKNVFLKLAGEWSQLSTFKVDYMAERSIQDALLIEEGDTTSILISYSMMFAYIAIALGYFSKVHSKVQSALLGIVIVLASIGCSIGFCSTIGIPLTLIIVDVIPFLLVAIGVDNMFIISNEFWFRCRVHLRRLPKGSTLRREDVVNAMGEALGEVGGTIFLAGASEGLAFSLGATTNMPAVRAFCLYSGVAILVNLGLQLTVFVAFLSLDARRAASGRYDALPCLRHDLEAKTVQKYNPIVEEGEDDPDDSLVRSPLTPQESNFDQPRSFSDCHMRTLKDVNSISAVCFMQNHKERVRDKGLYSLSGVIRYFLRNYYVPKFLFNRLVQIVVVILFLGQGFQMLFLSAPLVELGLRPTDPIPDHYYLRSTLGAVEQYLQVGPLVYFAVPAPNKPLLNFSQPEVMDAMESVFETLRHDTAYVEPSTVASWFEDFRYFLCYYNNPMRNFSVGNGCINLEALGVDPNTVNMDLNCHGKARKLPSWWIAALKQFLKAPGCCYEGSTNTGICGFQYDQEVTISLAHQKPDGTLVALPRTLQYAPADAFEYVTASRIRAQTVTLSTNRDYIASLASCYNTTDKLNQSPLMQSIGMTLFPYSIYFVYYAQYLNLPQDAARQLGSAVGAVVAVTFLVLSSVSSTLSIALCILLILVNLVGIMYWWSIDVNAISVVNLVMCVGISVEFCAHIAVAFCGTKGPIRRRMMAAMVDMGSNVICGITLTKLLGVSVLAFSPSQVFRKYYFRMYVSIVILGALHGLVFLPCLLLLVGASFRLRRYKFATL